VDGSEADLFFKLCDILLNPVQTASGVKEKVKWGWEANQI
jgi:hypothetical protein